MERYFLGTFEDEEIRGALKANDKQKEEKRDLGSDAAMGVKAGSFRHASTSNEGSFQNGSTHASTSNEGSFFTTTTTTAIICPALPRASAVRFRRIFLFSFRVVR